MEKIRDIGGIAGGLLMLLVFLSIPIIFFLGAAEFSVWALDWFPGIIGTATLTCILLLPLAIIPVTRGFASGSFALASLIFGVCLWLYALAFTYLEWGMFGVIVGIMIFGAGVVLMGILAAIFSGTWIVLGNIAFLLALFLGARLMSAWMTHLVERRELGKIAREAPSSVTLVQRSED